jgi:hypothetical protein
MAHGPQPEIKGGSAQDGMTVRSGGRPPLTEVIGIKPASQRLCTASAKSVDVLEAAYERSIAA